MCTQLTHSAQQQQHTAHHNGYHDGQLAAAELHFSNGVMEVPHMHLERQTHKSELLENLVPLSVLFSCLRISSVVLSDITFSRCHVILYARHTFLNT